MKQIPIIWKKTLYILGMILIGIVWIRVHTYMISLVPNGVNIDEAGMAYDAYSLSNWGVDRYLTYKPVYLINYGGGQSALYAYICAFIMKFLGYNIRVFRLPALIFSFITAVCGYIIIKKKWNKMWAMLGFFLLTILPYFIQQARIGLDCNLMLGAVTLSILVLIIAIEKKKTYLYIVDGILWGISLYTYALSYMIIPIFLILVSIYLLSIKKVNIKDLAIAALPLFILALPLILMIIINTFNFDSIVTPFFTIPRLPVYRGSEINIDSIWRNLTTLLHNIFLNDEIPYNALVEFSTMYVISIPLCVIGFLYTLYESIHAIIVKKFDISVVILLYTVSQLIIGITRASANINHMNGIYFTFVFFIVASIRLIFNLFKWILGFIHISNKTFSKVKNILPALSTTLIIVVYTVNFFNFYDYYFHSHIYIDVNLFNLSPTLEIVDQYSELLDSKEDVYVDAYFIYYLLNKKIPPQDLSWDDNLEINRIDNFHFNSVHSSIYENIDHNAAYIIRSSNLLQCQLFDEIFENKTSDGKYVIYYN